MKAWMTAEHSLGLIRTFSEARLEGTNKACHNGDTIINVLIVHSLSMTNIQMKDTFTVLPIHYYLSASCRHTTWNYGVHDRLHIYPLCGIFHILWNRHQRGGTKGF